MKSFKEYLAESVKENHYAIKFAMQPTDEQCKVVEAHLQKYGLVRIGKAEPVLNDKMDFYDITDKDVWQIPVVTSMPFSVYTVLQELKVTLNIPQDFIVVRASNEPVQVYADKDEFDFTVNDIAKKDGLTPAARLGTDRFYNAEEEPLLTDLFGNEYNKRLLDYLTHVAEERPSDQYEPAAPLFSWIDMNKVMDKEAVQADDFNKQFDTPKPVNKGVNKQPIEPVNLGNEGNFDDMAIQNVKLMKNKAGKRENFLAPRAGLKAEKVR